MFGPKMFVGLCLAVCIVQGQKNVTDPLDLTEVNLQDEKNASLPRKWLHQFTQLWKGIPHHFGKRSGQNPNVDDTICQQNKQIKDSGVVHHTLTKAEIEKLLEQIDLNDGSVFEVRRRCKHWTPKAPANQPPMLPQPVLLLLKPLNTTIKSTHKPGCDSTNSTSKITEITVQRKPVSSDSTSLTCGPPLSPIPLPPPPPPPHPPLTWQSRPPPKSMVHPTEPTVPPTKSTVLLSDPTLPQTKQTVSPPSLSQLHLDNSADIPSPRHYEEEIEERYSVGRPCIADASPHKANQKDPSAQFLNSNVPHTVLFEDVLFPAKSNKKSHDGHSLPGQSSFPLPSFNGCFPYKPPTKPTLPPTKPTIPSTDPTLPSTKPSIQPTDSTSPPTKPTVLPTMPTVPPTEQTAPPTEPTVPPTEPTIPPTKATLPPTESTIPSTEPTVPPTEPTAPPTEPTVPTEPTLAPTKSTAAPTKPTVPPTEPAASPTRLTAPPTKPTVLPFDPTLPPTKPTVPPTNPTLPPTKPTASPPSSSQPHLDNSTTLKDVLSPRYGEEEIEERCSAGRPCLANAPPHKVNQKDPWVHFLNSNAPDADLFKDLLFPAKAPKKGHDGHRLPEQPPFLLPPFFGCAPPTKPTLPPTKPTIAPTEPTLVLTELTAPPTNPTVPPTNSTVSPTKPTMCPVPPPSPSEPPCPVPPSYPFNSSLCGLVHPIHPPPLLCYCIPHPPAQYPWF